MMPDLRVLIEGVARFHQLELEAVQELQQKGVLPQSKVMVQKLMLTLQAVCLMHVQELLMVFVGLDLFFLP